MEAAVRRRVVALILAVLALSVGIGARLTYLQVGCRKVSLIWGWVGRDQTAKFGT